MYACDFCLVDDKDYKQVKIINTRGVNLVICLDCDKEINKKGVDINGKKIC